MMLAAAKEEAIRLGFSTAVISSSICGDVNAVAAAYAELAADLGECVLDQSSTGYIRLKYEKEQVLNLKCHLNDVLKLDFGNKGGICILGAGEPTVHILGKGKGGRNQHLALQFSVAVRNYFKKIPSLENVTISFLSCGTDGFDGPTDAAGAIGSSVLCPLAEKSDLDPQRFLRNSDSNGFFSTFLKGDCLVKTGHTGTNVMDLHVLIINKIFPRDEYIKERATVTDPKC